MDNPEDKGNAVYLTFILYGIGVLLPFNVIMACLDFYANTVSETRILKSDHFDLNVDARVLSGEYLAVRHQCAPVDDLSLPCRLR